MKHRQIELPFAKNALEPHISAETMDYHYGKHHAAYVTKLNKQLQHHELEDATLEEIIRQADGSLFNNAAQVWNHNFYWQCLSPNGGEPGGNLKNALQKNFSSLDEFRRLFNEKAASNFASGWTWLVQDDEGALAVVNTNDAETPLTDGLQPLLVCDVWEHAYYIDYRNDRAAYLEAFWKLVNWPFVADNFAAANR